MKDTIPDWLRPTIVYLIEIKQEPPAMKLLIDYSRSQGRVWTISEVRELVKEVKTDMDNDWCSDRDMSTVYEFLQP